MAKITLHSLFLLKFLLKSLGEDKPRNKNPLLHNLTIPQSVDVHSIQIIKMLFFPLCLPNNEHIYFIDQVRKYLFRFLRVWRILEYQGNWLELKKNFFKAIKDQMNRYRIFFIG